VRSVSRAKTAQLFSHAPFSVRFAAKQRISIVPAAAPFTVEAKQNSLRRQRTAEKARMNNKSRKSEISTRMKKVRARGRKVELGWLCGCHGRAAFRRQ
jgi:hypothetical protein